MVDLIKQKQGKRDRAAGKKFELAVRKDLEKREFVVSKWSNNVKDNQLVPAKAQFNPFFKRIVGEGSGLPDFIAIKRNGCLCQGFDIWGVEAKMNGKLDKEEREKFVWLSNKKIFSKLLIASKDNKIVKYEEFTCN